jgi:hypothetical protein
MRSPPEREAAWSNHAGRAESLYYGVVSSGTPVPIGAISAPSTERPESLTFAVLAPHRVGVEPQRERRVGVAELLHHVSAEERVPGAIRQNQASYSNVIGGTHQASTASRRTRINARSLSATPFSQISALRRVNHPGSVGRSSSVSLTFCRLSAMSSRAASSFADVRDCHGCHLIEVAPLLGVRILGELNGIADLPNDDPATHQHGHLCFEWLRQQLVEDRRRQKRPPGQVSSRADPPEDLTYLLMLERFNYFLGRRNDVGVIVSDEQKGSEDAIRHAHSRYRKSGTGYALIDNVIETPSSLRRTGRACCRSRTWQRGW